MVLIIQLCNPTYAALIDTNYILCTSIKYGPINLWSNRVTLQEIEVKLLNELFFLWMVEKFVVDDCCQLLHTQLLELWIIVAKYFLK